MVFVIILGRHFFSIKKENAIKLKKKIFIHIKKAARGFL